MQIDNKDGGQEVEAVYRFLVEGEVIEATDEFVADDYHGWQPPAAWAVGMEYPSRIFKPVRRRVAGPSAPDGWLPIETAPKDGTVCIVAFPLYNDVSNGLKVTAARFYEAEYLGDRTSGWEQLLDSDGVMTIWEPTHWRPLPPPPAGK